MAKVYGLLAAYIGRCGGFSKGRWLLGTMLNLSRELFQWFYIDHASVTVKHVAFN